MRPAGTPAIQDIFKILQRRTAAPNADSLDDEMKHYLDTPTQTVLNPVQWWKDRRELYPNLSRMAIDFLTTPGTSFFALVSACVAIE